MSEASDALRQLIYGFRSTQLVAIVARLGVADAVQRGPRTAASVAEAVGAEPGALHRVMRALTSLGVFAETDDGRFTSTPVGEALASDAAQSLRDVAGLYGDAWLWHTYGALMHSVRTG